MPISPTPTTPPPHASNAPTAITESPPTPLLAPPTTSPDPLSDSSAATSAADAPPTASTAASTGTPTRAPVSDSVTPAPLNPSQQLLHHLTDATIHMSAPPLSSAASTAPLVSASAPAEPPPTDAPNADIPRLNSSPESDQRTTTTDRENEMDLDEDEDGNRDDSKVLDAIRNSLLGPDAADYADVTLITLDKVEIPACRALLAIRSPYFKKLFFLPFIEREQSLVPINVHSTPLKQVLYFAYTDSCPLLDLAEQAVESLSVNNDNLPEKSKLHPHRGNRRHVSFSASRAAFNPVPSPHLHGALAGRFFPSSSTVSNGQSANMNESTLGKRRQPDDVTNINMRMPSINALIDLLRAADYVQMSNLSKRVLTATRELLEGAPRMACATFEALCSSPIPPSDVCAPLFKQAAFLIRQKPRECLGVPDVRSRLGSTGMRASPATPSRPLHHFFNAASGGPVASSSNAAATGAAMATGFGPPGAQALSEMLKSGSADAGFCNASAEHAKEYLYPVCVLSESSLDKILSDPDIFTSETYLFEVLFTWATNGALITDLKMNSSKFKVPPSPPIYRSNRNPNNNNNKDKINSKNKDNNNNTIPSISSANDSLKVIDNSDANPRWVVAKRLADRIDLERLKPSFIRDYVMRSGLVNKDSVYKTFMQQALEAERGRPLFDNFRGGSRWAGDSKKIRAISLVGLDFPLLCPWLTSGRHEWSFRIIRNSTTLWLGVMSREQRPGTGLFFEGGGGWAYSTAGRIMPTENTDFANKYGQIGPAVYDGNIVRIVLNLTKSGTMTVIVDGSPKSLSAFKDLRSKARRFLPVVALAAPAEVELIGEKHHVQ